MNTSGARTVRTVAGAVVLPVLAVGLLAGCGKHSSASHGTHNTYSSSHSSKSSHHSGMLSSHSCHPLSKAGNCYEPGEQCAKTQHHDSGKAGNGAKIRCENVRGVWRWES